MYCRWFIISNNQSLTEQNYTELFNIVKQVYRLSNLEFVIDSPTVQHTGFVDRPEVKCFGPLDCPLGCCDCSFSIFLIIDISSSGQFRFSERLVDSHCDNWSCSHI